MEVLRKRNGIGIFMIRTPYTQPAWRTSQNFFLRLMGRNIPIVLFLAAAMMGMLMVYWYFTPNFGEAQSLIVAGSLSAPIYKNIPSEPIRQRLAQSPGPIRVALVSGHRGNDSGAVCPDGLTEAETVSKIAEAVAANLRADGLHVDVLDEFDTRLNGLRATLFLSIHADSCEYFTDTTTGFKMAGAPHPQSDRLVSCVEQAYKEATQMTIHENTITTHMTDYHAFREIDSNTPAAIIEVGFLNLDRPMLTTHVDQPIAGITNGLRCFLNKQP